MEEVNISETESRYFGDLFLCCDIDRTGKIPILKATELFRSANLSNDVLRQITSIVGISDAALYISRVQFYSCLKLIAASQLSIPLRHEIIASSIVLPLPKFSWRESPNAIPLNTGCGTVTETTTPSTATNALINNYGTNGIIDERNACVGDGEIIDKETWHSKIRSSNLIELVKGTHIDNINCDLQSTDSEVEHNDADILNRTHRRETTTDGGSPEAWSTASDSPTPTNSVAERPWAKGNLWHGLICEEQRQLLGTEEESSDRHSSDDDNDSDIVNIYQITNEQHEYYLKQFRALQPDQKSILPGHLARVFFEKSRIPVEELRRIWQLCDVTRDGALNLGEFKAAMHLVVLRRNNIPLPPVLPTCLFHTITHPIKQHHSSLTKTTTATSTTAIEPPEADLLHLHDDDTRNNEYNVNLSNNNKSNKITSHQKSKNQKISSLSPIISTTVTTGITTITNNSNNNNNNNSSINNNNIAQKKHSLSNTPPLMQQSILAQQSLPLDTSSNSSLTSDQIPVISSATLSATSSLSSPPPLAQQQQLPLTQSSVITTSSIISETTTLPKIKDINGTTTTTTITKPLTMSTTTTTTTTATKDWLNQSKEWTKFTESPTSNVSSPGPKPLNFDMQRTAQAVVSDPQILHPVPLRVTPVGGISCVSGGGAGGGGNSGPGSANNSMDTIDDESSSRIIQRKSDNLVYDGGIITIRDNTCDAPSPKQQQNTIAQHRDSLQNDLRAIQRPQAKKLTAKNIGAIPPPPQREPSIGGTGSSSAGGTDVNDGGNINATGINLNNSVNINNISNTNNNNNNNDIINGKKDQQPPLPPPRPHRHARSSSLDLNKLKLNAPTPPEVPPRISPQITTQISLDAQIDVSNLSFADFAQFLDSINEITNLDNINNNNGNNILPTPPRQMIPSIQSSQRSSAFEVYRKPTPRNSNSPPSIIQQHLQQQQQHQQQQQQQQQQYHQQQTPSLPIDINNREQQRTYDFEKRISMISDSLRFASLRPNTNISDVLRQLKEQNTLLVKLCNDLSDELLNLQQKKQGLRLQLDSNSNNISNNNNNNINNNNNDNDNDNDNDNNNNNDNDNIQNINNNIDNNDNNSNDNINNNNNSKNNTKNNTNDNNNTIINNNSTGGNINVSGRNNNSTGHHSLV